MSLFELKKVPFDDFFLTTRERENKSERKRNHKFRPSFSKYWIFSKYLNLNWFIMVYLSSFSKMSMSMVFISHIYICRTSENSVWIDKYVFMNFLNFDVTHLSRFLCEWNLSTIFGRKIANFSSILYLCMNELSWIAELTWIDTMGLTIRIRVSEVGRTSCQQWVEVEGW